MPVTTRKKKSSRANGSSKRRQPRNAPAPAPAKAATFKSGDVVKIITAGSSKFGEVVAVIEVDEVERDVNTEHGWFSFDEVELAPQTRRTEVDGKPADVVLDGKTGGVKGAANGKAPHQPALIEVPMEQLVHDYNKLAKERDEAASQRGSWGAKIKALDERINPILAEMRRRDDEKNGVEPSLFTPPADEAEAEDEDEDDE